MYAGPVTTVDKVRPSGPTVRNEIEAETGSIVVSAKVPGIEISVGGRQMGQAGPGKKLVIDDLEVGRHRLLAKKEGYYDWETEIEVRPRQRIEIPIEMDSKNPQPSRSSQVAIATPPPPPTGPQIAPPVDVQRRSEPPIAGQAGGTGEMALVPAGEFTMGFHDGDSNERPPHKVYLDAFYIDRFEVTNLEFKKFVDGGGYDRNELWTAAGWAWRTGQKQAALGGLLRDIKSSKGTRLPRYWGESKLSDDRQPVVGVSWYEADAYCKFVGKRLPTEAEWEKAARGPEGKRFPWGDYWDDRRANHGDSGIKRPAAVGSFPTGASAYGVQDLAGNAAEWVADWYQSEYYKRSPERNPQGAEGGGKKVIRGASFDDDGKDLRSTRRKSEDPDERSEKIGFRCARSER
jgi:formylglycine-generating enzyme required for sulfatase activity